MKSSSIDGFTVFYREGTVDEEVLDHSFKKDIFFPVIPDYRPRPDGVVIDVGAHIGTFSILSASQMPRGRVLALEPCAETWELLSKNVSANASGIVVPLRLALGGQAGKTTLFHNPKDGNWGHSTTKPMGAETEVVEEETLAGLMDRHALESVDLVKFNCEGAEFATILATPADYLARVRLMLVLYHMDMVSGPGLTDVALLAKLRDAGFFCRVLYRTPTRGWIVARNARYYSRLADLFRRAANRAKRALTSRADPVG